MFEYEDFNEFIRLLDFHKVRYLLIGGYAVTFHGYPRYTKDLDIWIAPDVETAGKMMAVLDEFGFGSIGLGKSDFLKDESFIQLGHEPVRIDIVIKKRFFDPAWRNRVKHLSGNEKMNFVSVKYLVKLKNLAGRPQDIADISRLLKKRKGKSRK